MLLRGCRLTTHRAGTAATTAAASLLWANPSAVATAVGTAGWSRSSLSRSFPPPLVSSISRHELKFSSTSTSATAVAAAAAASNNNAAATDVFSYLSSRGLVANYSNGLPAVVASSKRIVYAGFDPTGDSLHLGNLLVLIILRHFQRFGHKPIVLVLLKHLLLVFVVVFLVQLH
jgi:hypothetical protein